MKRFFSIIVFAAVGLIPAQASAGVDGKDILENRCAECHSIAGPAPQTIRELWNRDAPDLFYAGNKFRSEWLLEWLQKPVRIRPSGVNYLRAINSASTRFKTSAEEKDPKKKKYDVLWGEVLKPLKHETLNADEAKAVTAELMKLKPFDDQIAGMMLDSSKKVSLDDGEVLFDKVYGCLSCHQIEPNFGGYTGSEVYTAGKRLQPAFMLSYIKRPRNWDPKIWMPNGNVKPDDLQKIVNYLVLLSKENFDAQ